MGLTKRQIIDQALKSLNVGVTFSIPDRVLASCADELEVMMGSWLIVMPSLGYILRDDIDDNSLDLDSNLPTVANNAVIKNLAINISSFFGKEPKSSVRTAAAKLYSDLKLYFLPNSIPYAVDPRMIRGAGDIYSKANLIPFFNGQVKKGCECG